jgi:DnaJ-class molecular chaperone
MTVILGEDNNNRPLEGVRNNCSKCGGTGKITNKNNEKVTCQTCRGTGKVWVRG